MRSTPPFFPCRPATSVCARFHSHCSLRIARSGAAPRLLRRQESRARQPRLPELAASGLTQAPLVMDYNPLPVGISTRPVWESQAPGSPPWGWGRSLLALPDLVVEGLGLARVSEQMRRRERSQDADRPSVRDAPTEPARPVTSPRPGTGRRPQECPRVSPPACRTLSSNTRSAARQPAGSPSPRCAASDLIAAGTSPPSGSATHLIDLTGEAPLARLGPPVWECHALDRPHGGGPPARLPSGSAKRLIDLTGVGGVRCSPSRPGRRARARPSQQLGGRRE